MVLEKETIPSSGERNHLFFNGIVTMSGSASCSFAKRDPVELQFKFSGSDFWVLYSRCLSKQEIVSFYGPVGSQARLNGDEVLRKEYNLYPTSRLAYLFFLFGFRELVHNHANGIMTSSGFM